MLSERAAEPFDSPAHIFEVLWNGIRALAFVESGVVRLQDQWGRDITNRYPELQEIGGRVRESGLVIDGEIVCVGPSGTPEFGFLRPRLNADDPGQALRLAEQAPVTFQAFDLVYRNGQTTTGWPLRRRKQMLRSVVRTGPAIAIPGWVERDGVAFFEAAREHGLDGMVAKESDSRYLQGQRSRAWLTVRVYERDHFVVGGYTYEGRWHPREPSRRARAPFSSLLLGLYGNDGRLRYVGEVTGGFDDMDALTQHLDDLTDGHCPFDPAPDVGRLVFWCVPELTVAVRYAEWTAGGLLRFPVFEAARPDVPANSCRTRAEG